VETIFTQGRRGPELRPFAASAEVVCRGCSEALQRAITDFGADGPFADAAAKLCEHYGIEVPVSTVRAITEHHGAAMRARQPQGSPWPDAPVRACSRYISNRTELLDYQGALAADLPIGSGEIESAHRYVIQSRLKRAGAWWTLDNLDNMLALRILRANREWEDYWSEVQPVAA